VKGQRLENKDWKRLISKIKIGNKYFNVVRQNKWCGAWKKREQI